MECSRPGPSSRTWLGTGEPSKCTQAPTGAVPALGAGRSKRLARALACWDPSPSRPPLLVLVLGTNQGAWKLTVIATLLSYCQTFLPSLCEHLRAAPHNDDSFSLSSAQPADSFPSLSTANKLQLSSQLANLLFFNSHPYWTQLWQLRAGRFLVQLQLVRGVIAFSTVSSLCSPIHLPALAGALCWEQ